MGPVKERGLHLAAAREGKLDTAYDPRLIKHYHCEVRWLADHDTCQYNSDGFF